MQVQGRLLTSACADVIKRRLLDPQRLAPYIDSMWDALEAAAPGAVDRHDPATYVDAGARWMSAIGQGQGNAHSQGHAHGRLHLGPPGTGNGGNLWWNTTSVPGFLDVYPHEPALLRTVEALIGGPVKRPNRSRGLYTIWPAGERSAEERAACELGPHNDMETEHLLSTALLGDVGPLDGAFVR